MKLKKAAALFLTAASVLSLAACGSSGTAETTVAAAEAAAETEASAETEAAENESTAESAAEPVTLKIGFTGTLYEELWAPAQEILKGEGIDLEFVQFSDFSTPNNALANGEIDLNAFQHRIYLQSEIDNYGYEIQSIGNTLVSPLNIYSDKISSIDELKDGDTIAIPDDATNGGRALKVLEAAGIVELDPEAGFNPTVDDITATHPAIEISELKANVIPSALADVTAAVVNGNYALDFGLDSKEAIYQDNTYLDVEEYWALIAARTADVEDPEKKELLKKVVDAFHSDETKAVFDEKFAGYYTPVGWDEDLLGE